MYINIENLHKYRSFNAITKKDVLKTDYAYKICTKVQYLTHLP